MGSAVFAVINALGEMISHVPAAGGQMTLAKRYFDPALAFAMGYNYVRQPYACAC